MLVTAQTMHAYLATSPCSTLHPHLDAQASCGVGGDAAGRVGMVRVNIGKDMARDTLGESCRVEERDLQLHGSAWKPAVPPCSIKVSFGRRPETQQEPPRGNERHYINFGSRDNDAHKNLNPHGNVRSVRRGGCRGGTLRTNNSSRSPDEGCRMESLCNRQRVFDDEGYIQRAACVCVNEGETQVLLVSSKKNPAAWLVPGGGLEVGEEAVTAAQREVWEEAGLRGRIARYLGIVESSQSTSGKKHRTAVFVLVVTQLHNDFPEARLGRRRKWFSVEEALVQLSQHRPIHSAYLQLMVMSGLKMTTAS
ncbi:uncharacterized protein LOC143025526 [Oratosquilla oratoria]|uniref:uncharacterized protein LOC143025526 n=1 Tax=Oratosquilla oratoria TaxID=337810 RepID=UPI003F772D72